MTTIKPLLFQGKVLNQNGQPINGATVQLWQTDINGNYLHPNAAVSSPLPQHVSIVENFQYFGTDVSDDNGNFDFLTYKPGIYIARPYSHFHFAVYLNASKEPTLITQFYFKDESPPFPDALELDVINVDAGTSYNYGSYMNGTIVLDDGALPDEGKPLLQTTPIQPGGPFYPVVDFFSFDNDLTTTQDSMDDIRDKEMIPTSTPVGEVIGPSSLGTATISPAAAKATSEPTLIVVPTKQPVQMPKPTSSALSLGDNCHMFTLFAASYIVSHTSLRWW